LWWPCWPWWGALTPFVLFRAQPHHCRQDDFIFSPRCHGGEVVVIGIVLAGRGGDGAAEARAAFFGC